MMKNFVQCLLLAFLLAKSSDAETIEPCGQCPSQPINRMLSMRGFANVMSNLRQLCPTQTGRCLCGAITLTCLGDIFNYCLLRNSPVLPGIPPPNFNCANITQLHRLRDCMCAQPSEGCGISNCPPIKLY